MGTIFDRAVQSVFDRGFHTVIPAPNICNPRLMAQLVRLGEEIGEFEEAKSKAEAVLELADVVIVCAQIAWLLGIGLNESIFRASALDASLPMAFGTLCRGLRKNDPTMIDVSLRLLVASSVALARENECADLCAVIETKLSVDERRGWMHSGNPRAN